MGVEHDVNVAEQASMTGILLDKHTRMRTPSFYEYILEVLRTFWLIRILP